MSQVEQAQAIRLRHYQGQRLQANDLQAEFDNLTWLRGLHIVGLHDTWGIALGFEVVLASNGARPVTLVNPGLAYDCLGREIVLTQVRTLPCPLPPAAASAQESEHHLVMSYDAELGSRSTGQEVAPCTDQAGQPGQEQPVFAWRRPDQVRLGLEVPLAALHLMLGSTPLFDLQVRRYAQPLARPHIAIGVTPREQLWEYWKESNQNIGYQIEVNTSAAGFVGTPFYLAELRLNSTDWPPVDKISANTPLPFLFTSLVGPDRNGFTFRLLPVTSDPSQLDLDFDLESSTPFCPGQVFWLGLERVGGQPLTIFLKDYSNVFSYHDYKILEEWVKAGDL